MINFSLKFNETYIIKSRNVDTSNLKILNLTFESDFLEISRISSVYFLENRFLRESVVFDQQRSLFRNSVSLENLLVSSCSVTDVRLSKEFSF